MTKQYQQEQQRQPALASSGVYAANYAILHEVAAKLRNGEPADVDTLASDFRRAMAAHRACQDRLDAIRSEIDAEVDRLPEAKAD